MTTPSLQNKGDLDSLLVAPAEETPDQRRARFAALRGLAQQPSLDSDALARIGQAFLRGSDYYFPAQDVCQVLQIVAAHPNTPLAILAQLVYCAPQAFCSNPIAPLIPLENPEWITQVSEPALLHLLRCVDTPPALVAQIAASPVGPSRRLARNAASLHIALRGEAGQDTWQEEMLAYWRRHVAEADEDTNYIYTQFAILNLLPDWAVSEGGNYKLTNARGRLWHAADPTTTSSEREQFIRTDPDWAVRLAATLNPAAPSVERFLLLNGLLGFSEEPRAVLRQARLLPSRPFLPAEDALTRCRELMRIAATVRESLPRFPYPAFAGVAHAPERIHASEGSDQYEYWERLLGWTLGVRPDKNGKWDSKTEALLDQLTYDANCLVRAAARGRLANPSLHFEW